LKVTSHNQIPKIKLIIGEEPLVNVERKIEKEIKAAEDLEADSGIAHVDKKNEGIEDEW
jgi:hypothetical protein